MAADEEAIKRRYREFVDLLPLTIALAGLSQSEGQRNFTTDQLEARSHVVMNAFKVARQIARDAARTSSQSSG